MLQFDYTRKFDSEEEAIKWISGYWAEYRKYVSHGLFGYKKFQFHDDLGKKNGVWIAHVTCEALES